MRRLSRYVVVTALLLGAFFTVSPKAEAAPSLKIAAMASANTQKGAKYVYGAEGPYKKGYDCSGLTYWAYKQHKKTLPRTAQGQYNSAKKISAKNRQPGDLVFIHDARGHVYHVGILTRVTKGTGWMVNANTGSYRGRKVVEAPVYEYTSGSPYATYGRY